LQVYAAMGGLELGSLVGFLSPAVWTNIMRATAKYVSDVWRERNVG
jgi:hypothetical protein